MIFFISFIEHSSKPGLPQPSFAFDHLDERGS